MSKFKVGDKVKIRTLGQMKTYGFSEIGCYLDSGRILRAIADSSRTGIQIAEKRDIYGGKIGVISGVTDIWEFANLPQNIKDEGYIIKDTMNLMWPACYLDKVEDVIREDIDE